MSYHNHLTVDRLKPLTSNSEFFPPLISSCEKLIVMHVKETRFKTQRKVTPSSECIMAHHITVQEGVESSKECKAQ